MKNTIGLSLILLSVPLFSSVSFRLSSEAISEGDGNFKAAVERAPVIVELFTSEGCSSCPPADQLLARLEAGQPVSGALIIPLSEHVDYWNRLGWADPYSSGSFSERQSEYARVFSTDGVYTPQMVVDGRAEFVGSNSDEARRAIAEAARRPKAEIQLELKSGVESHGQLALSIRIEPLAGLNTEDTSEVILAITENGLSSSVSRGENAGRKLTHTAVVRKLKSLGVLEKGKGFSTTVPTDIESAWKSENVRAVVFVQERASRRILGAAITTLKQSSSKESAGD